MMVNRAAEERRPPECDQQARRRALEEQEEACGTCCSGGEFTTVTRNLDLFCPSPSLSRIFPALVFHPLCIFLLCFSSPRTAVIRAHPRSRTTMNTEEYLYIMMYVYLFFPARRYTLHPTLPLRWR